MKKSTIIKLLVGVAILVTAITLFVMQNVGKTPESELIDAIEWSAEIDLPQRVHKVADTFTSGRATVCFFESAQDGIGVCLLKNKGTSEKPDYIGLDFKYISYSEISDDITKVYLLNNEKNGRWIFGLAQNVDDKYVVINGKQIEISSYTSESDKKTVYYWTHFAKNGEKIKVTAK